MENRLQSAYDALLIALNIPTDAPTLAAYEVPRVVYTEALQQVERVYRIEQGDPDYLEWVLTLLGRSPKIIEETEEEKHGTD